jgi:signal transduction protein with GAF and PtsI domain
VEEGELVLFASSDQNRKTIGNVRLRLNEGLTGWVARERRLLAISREAYSDPRFKYFKDLPQDTFEAFCRFPSFRRTKWWASSTCNIGNPRIHTGGDMEMLSTLGEQVGCLLVLSRQKHPRPRVT